MSRQPADPDSPNRRIDIAINKLMGDVGSMAPDVAVKVIATAISWEKVKAKINEGDSEFDAANL